MTLSINTEKQLDYTMFTTQLSFIRISLVAR